jgi:hypothetical protein
VITVRLEDELEGEEGTASALENDELREPGCPLPASGEEELVAVIQLFRPQASLEDLLQLHAASGLLRPGEAARER